MFDPVSRELGRSMLRRIIQYWVDSDCIREAVRAVVHLPTDDGDQPVTHDISILGLLSFLT